MKTVIKYCAVIFALLLAGTIISGCVEGGIMIVRAIADRNGGEIRIDGEVVFDFDSFFEEGAFEEMNGGFRVFGIQFGGERETKSGAYYPTGPVQEIQVDGVDGELEIVRGDSFCVTYQNIPVEYTMEVKDGKLLLKDESKQVFVVHIGQSDARLCLTIPETVQLDRVFVDNGSGKLVIDGLTVEVLDLDGGSGSMKAEHIAVKKLLVDGGSGSVKIENATAEQSRFDMGSGGLQVSKAILGTCKLDSGSGSCRFEGVTADGMSFDGGSGRLVYQGELNGNGNFHSGSGSVSVELAGKKEEYNLRASLGSGGFYVDGAKQQTSGNGVTNYDTAIYTLVFNTGSGRVSLNFE